MRRDQKDDYILEFAQDIIHLLLQGTAPWQKPWKAGELCTPFNGATHKPYRGGNVIQLLIAQVKLASTDPRWMSYRQALSIGGQVKKGEKATICRHYTWFKKRAARDVHNKIIKDENGYTKMINYRLSKPFIRYFPLFNAKQIDNLPTYQQNQPSCHWQAHKRAEDLLNRSGATIHHQFQDGAFYHPQRDMIYLPHKSQFAEDAGYYGTALHELSHWTAHEKRLNRPLSTQFGSPEYAREELIAELGSLMIAQQYQLPFNPGHHLSYVQSWVKLLKEDAYEIMRATRFAQQITTFCGQFIQNDMQQNNPINTDMVGTLPA